MNGSLRSLPATVVDPPASLSNATDAESWVLDDVGNPESRTVGETSPQQTTYTSNALNQIDSITASGGATPVPTYDFLGQMRSDPSKGEENGYRYVWDAFGRLTQVWLSSSSGETEIARYRYDALGRRVEKHTTVGVRSDDTTWFVYDGWRVIEERGHWTDAGGVDHTAVRARYGHGPGIDAVVWMDRDIGSDGDPANLGMPDGTLETRLYVQSDGLGSTTALTRSDGAAGIEVVERFTYAGYGRASAWSGEDAGGGWSATSVAYAGVAEPQSRYGMPYLFAGRRSDAETGLSYNRMRYLDPELGRFLSRDPLGYGDGPNVYAYAGGRPEAASDPMGLFDISAFKRFQTTGAASAGQISQWQRSGHLARSFGGSVMAMSGVMRSGHYMSVSIGGVHGASANRSNGAETVNNYWKSLLTAAGCEAEPVASFGYEGSDDFRTLLSNGQVMHGTKEGEFKGVHDGDAADAEWVSREFLPGVAAELASNANISPGVKKRDLDTVLKYEVRMDLENWQTKAQGTSWLARLWKGRFGQFGMKVTETGDGGLRIKGALTASEYIGWIQSTVYHEAREQYYGRQGTRTWNPVNHSLAELDELANAQRFYGGALKGSWYYHASFRTSIGQLDHDWTRERRQSLAQQYENLWSSWLQWLVENRGEPPWR